jgi:hypothetical protein
LRVKIADGALMYCDKWLLNCPWSCAGQTFNSQFKFLPLGTYEGILGLVGLPDTVLWKLTRRSNECLLTIRVLLSQFKGKTLAVLPIP